ncbi:uncharacterized protein [Argopecten irradians]|uniref:uncharacterized protein n=1 Tax=Argopecten irradians TaxID=31199 RepID=UPI00371C399C
MAGVNENGEQGHSQRYHGSARGGRTSGGTRGSGPPNYLPPQFLQPHCDRGLLPTPILGPRFSNNRLQRGRGNMIPSLFDAPMTPPRHIPPYTNRTQQNFQYTQETNKPMPAVHTDQSYLKSHMAYLKGLSENAKGIQGFSSPGASAQNPIADEISQSSGQQQRGNRRGTRGVATIQNSGEKSDSSSISIHDLSIRSTKMNKRFGSMDDLSGDRGRAGYLGSRGGRDENRGHRGSMIDISNTDRNPSGRSSSANRGHSRNRDQGQGDRRERGRDRGRHGGQNEDGINSNKRDEESNSDSDSDETDSISGSEASRSIVSGSQDLSSERINDFDNTKKKKRPRRKKSPRSKSLNEEVQTYEDDKVDENQIFSYLVKSCGGIIKFDDFVRECDLIPTDLDVQKWFRCHKRRFKLFQKQRKILYISAFYFDATLCLHYNWVYGRMKSCSKAGCEDFHICKEYISGNCSFSETCRFSHSFRDANNLEHKKNLGLLEFSDKEMVTILRNRYPRVCSEFLKTTSCSLGEDCPELHICSLSLRGKCSKSAKECSLGHSLETDHNQWVLKAMGYCTWITGTKQPLLKKVILFARSLEAAGDETTEVALDEEFKHIADEIAALKKGTEIKKPISRSNRFKSRDPNEDDNASFSMTKVQIRERGSSVEAKPMQEPPEEQEISKSSKRRMKRISKPSKPDMKVEAPKTWLDDAASDIPLCLKFLESNCPGGCPRGHHHYTTDVGLAPYIWQIKHDDTWTSFHLEVSEEIEEGFCKNLEIIDAEILIDNHAAYMVHVCVSDARDMKGVVWEQDGVLLDDPLSLPVRRLSTQSYVEVKDKKPAFTTQWRWSWKDDTNQWQLFEPNNFQITLERKYKYGQTTYLFTREDYRFKYRIDFRTFRQINLDTRKTREICRRPIFVSKEEVKNKKFPVCLEVVDPINKPQNFVPWDLSHAFELVELDRVTPEFKTLREKFYETLDNTRFDILYIYRVQNWKLYQDYEVRKINMKKELQLSGQNHEVNEKFLFHGTDTMDTCRGICTNNFDFRTSGKNATLYGQGSYFAETSKYSNNYTRPGKNHERYMFQAKVLVGQYTKGQSSYKRPPERPGQTHMLYDSCVDNEANPSMYIIFERSQAYPEYLIAYREKNTSGFETKCTIARPANFPTERVGVVTTTPATNVTPSAKPIPPPKPPALHNLIQTQYRQPLTVSPVSVAQAPAQPIVDLTTSCVEDSAYPTSPSSDRLQYPTTSSADRHRRLPYMSEDDRSFSSRESHRSQDELLQPRTSLSDRLQYLTTSYADFQRIIEYMSDEDRSVSPRENRRSQDELLQSRTSLSEDAISSQANQPEVSVISEQKKKDRGCVDFIEEN